MAIVSSFWSKASHKGATDETDPRAILGLHDNAHSSGLLRNAPGRAQDPPATGKQKAGEGSQAADARTGRDDSTGAQPAETDAASSDPFAKSSSKSKTKAKPEPEFVHKTDAQWRKILTRTQYMVTRQKATEPAFSGQYATGHFRGMFLCVCCEAEVFSAAAKFDSGTGWPSFDRPASARAISRVMDYDAFEPRVEVNCRRCGAHLGHVFDDGPTMTGLRFCINSASLKLRPPEGESAPKALSRTTSRTSSKARARTKQKASTRMSGKTKNLSTKSQKSTASPTTDPPADEASTEAAKSSPK